MSESGVLGEASVFVYPGAAPPAAAVRRELRERGFRLLEPADAAEAASVLPELRPDLVVIEAADAADATAALHAVALSRHASQVPVLVLASPALRPLEAPALFALGAADVVLSPPSPALVAAKCAALVRLKRRLDAARELSVRDELTGLYNRRFFLERLEQEVARARRTGQGLALLLLDVDSFKKVNDTFGHPAGDAVLRGVAETSLRHTRRSDLVARVGGDEFAILLVANTLEGAAVCAEGLRRRVASARLDLPDKQRVTVSLGVAAWPGAAVADPLEDLFRVADQALLRAKGAGKDRVALALP